VESAFGGKADVKFGFVKSGFAETGTDTLSLVGGFEGRRPPVENISGKPMVVGGRPFRHISGERPISQATIRTMYSSRRSGSNA
jgi:hypothetical protein